MAYPGSGTDSPHYDDSHRMQDLPHASVSIQETNIGRELTRQYGHEDDVSRGLLSHQGPFSGPFDEPHSRGPSPRPASRYSLTESYAPNAAYHDPYNTADSIYSGNTLEDPTAYGVPGRVASPYSRSETSSTEAWRQRQGPGMGPGGKLRRYATRKVKLVQGSVLSVDYPVPSAIQNATQTRYRNDLEGGNEEFTHMRCKSTPCLYYKLMNRHRCDLRPE